MAEAAAATPQELQAQERQNQQEQERSRVHPMDPDFFLFALPFAILVDALDIILELTSILIIPKLLGLILDAGTMIILGSWMYWRVGKIIKTKKRQQQASAKALKGASRTVLRGPLRKIIIRLGLVTLIEAIPLVGILFAWTVMVVLTLREK